MVLHPQARLALSAFLAMTLGAAGPAYREWKGASFSCEVPVSWKDLDPEGVSWSGPGKGRPPLLSATYHEGPWPDDPARAASRDGLSRLLGVPKASPGPRRELKTVSVAGRPAKSFESVEESRPEDASPGKGAPRAATPRGRVRAATTVLVTEKGHWILRYSAPEAEFARHRHAYERLLATFKPL